MKSYSSLEEIGAALRKQLPVNAIFTSVNIRLILQTGINLKKVSSEQNRDTRLIQSVSHALTRMGVEFEGDGQ